MYEVEYYKTESGNCPVEEYEKDISKSGNIKELAQLKIYKERLGKYGMQINSYFPESIRVIREGVWELRPGKHRVFFFGYTGTKFVLLHAYRKFKRKAPPKEIEKAINEMKDYKRRNQYE